MFQSDEAHLVAPGTLSPKSIGLLKDAIEWTRKTTKVSMNIVVAQVDWQQVCKSRERDCYIVALQKITVNAPGGLIPLSVLEPGDMYPCLASVEKTVEGASGGPLCVTFWKNPDSLKPYRPLDVHNATVSYTFALGAEAWLGAEIMKTELFGIFQLNGETLRKLKPPDGRSLELKNVGWPEDERLVAVVRKFLSAEELNKLNVEAGSAPWSLSRWSPRNCTVQNQNTRRNANFSAVPKHERPHCHFGGACGTMLMDKDHFLGLGAVAKKVSEFLQIASPAHLIAEGNAYEHCNKDASITWHGDNERGNPGFVACVRAGGMPLDMHFRRRVGTAVVGTESIMMYPGDMYVMPGETLGFGFSSAASGGRRNIVHAAYCSGIPAEKKTRVKRRANETGEDTHNGEAPPQAKKVLRVA